jgi:hypothetical protein
VIHKKGAYTASVEVKRRKDRGRTREGTPRTETCRSRSTRPTRTWPKRLSMSSRLSFPPKISISARFGLVCLH